MVENSPESSRQALMPAMLKAGDTVRFVSPASPPDKEGVYKRAEIYRGWGLKVEIGEHAFAESGYLAGTDQERLADLNDALRDPGVRAVIATRGGKGSYRIAGGMDFDAVRGDPKLVVGFSDITVLHLNLWKECRLVCAHGALIGGAGDRIGEDTIAYHRRALMGTADIILRPEAAEPTAALTTEGRARGRLLGGNLDMIATAAGWALPDLTGAILLIEAVGMELGQVDRQLTMLANAGWLDGIAGIAVGQFTRFKTHGAWTIADILRDHLHRLKVPVLGGLPVGHGELPRTVPLGTMADLNADTRMLTVTSGVRPDP